MRLTAETLNWARRHISTFYDSDFYPKLIEMQGLWANWDEILEYLTSKDLELISAKTPRFMAAPKASLGFRIVHQLDPLDSIIYTALVRSMCEPLAAVRSSKFGEVAFSYKISVDETGNFFASGNGHREYQDACEELAQEYDYVLVTDIVDFYNQIYHHRLQNSIETFGRETASSIEEFLKTSTSGVSRGVPVGPAASIVLAEATLMDVDQFIANRGFDHVRYVDDYRIFSNSPLELVDLIHDLCTYLYANHRLVINESKTRVLDSSSFIEEFISGETQLERDAAIKALRELHRSKKEANEGNYGMPHDEPEEGTDDYFDPEEFDKLKGKDKQRARAIALSHTVDILLSTPEIDLALARNMLRTARDFKVRNILPQVLENFDFFVPAIRDVVLYLETVCTPQAIPFQLHRFNEIVTKSTAMRRPFVRHWMEHLFSSRVEFSRSKVISDYMISGASLNGQASFSRRNGNVAWVRDHKNKIDNYGPWERRSIIASANILSFDEKDYWMGIIMRSDNIVDRSLAKYIKSL